MYDKIHYNKKKKKRTDSLEKTLIMGKIEDGLRRGRQRMRWLGGNTESLDMNLSNIWDLMMDGEVWHASMHPCSPWGHKESDMTEQLNWTELF